MSSTFSTQNRHTFLRRKYCFLPVAIALSPPVGRCEAAIGRPPLCSAIVFLSRVLSGLNSALVQPERLEWAGQAQTAGAAKSPLIFRALEVYAPHASRV